MILIDTQKEEFSKIKEIRIFGASSDENRLNGDVLMIALGGAGREVVRNLKGMLFDDITPEDNINFLLIDSDIPAMEQTIEDSKNGIGFDAMEVISIYRPNLADWKDEQDPELTVGTNGAKGKKKLGDLMFRNAYEDIRMLLFDKLDEIYHKSGTGRLDVIVVSGVSGGTGGGILSELTYNIRAYGKAKKWKNFRVGGCLMMPDVLFGQKAVSDNEKLVAQLNANGWETMQEMDRLMHILRSVDLYTFEHNGHKITMKDNIFDVCMLVTGKKDEEGYLAPGVIYKDTAQFLYKLMMKRYTDNAEEEADRKLLRDAFFSREADCNFKAVNESYYKFPTREIENICEGEAFAKAYGKLLESPAESPAVQQEIADLLNELNLFLSGKPGDEITLNVKGLINMGQFEKPAYKLIKKHQDNLYVTMDRGLTQVKQEIPVIMKEIKLKLWDALDKLFARWLNTYGPYAVIDLIGAAGVGACETEKGLTKEIRKLEEMQKTYQPTGEFSRIIESIKEIVAKRFFTFPSAKRETENGYYDAYLKETLSSERNLLMEGFDSQDVFGDTLRWLRQRAERIDDIYSQFGKDLKHAVEDLANDGKATVSHVLKSAGIHSFLPSDYITDERLDSFREGIIKLMLDNETNIDNGRAISVKPQMERIYQTFFIGLAAFGPEKMISAAFLDEQVTLQELNVMFVSPSNEKRNAVMGKAAEAFVREIRDERKLCMLKEETKEKLISRKYISVPDKMPYFSEAVKRLLVSEPYNERRDSIILNAGEIEISVDEMLSGVRPDMLHCAEAMRKAYESVE